MKVLHIVLFVKTVTVSALAQENNCSSVQQIQVKIITDSKDTLTTKGVSRIMYESPKEILSKMTDTLYLNKFVGTYNKSDDHKEINVIRKDTSLILFIPNDRQYELIAKGSFFFVIKDNPDMKVFFYINSDNKVNGINIQNKEQNYSALRKKI